MLIRFTVSNYRSFWESKSLSLNKGREKRLLNHINKSMAGGFETLRGAVIYGANGSGKSNLVKAMRDARNFIIEDTKIKPNLHFKLAAEAGETPTSFNFEFKISDAAYSYGFDCLKGNIVEEWLYQINSEKKDQMLFHRYVRGSISDVKFDDNHHIYGVSKEALQELAVLSKSTPSDTLFLYDLHKRGQRVFLSASRWFEEKLLIIDHETLLNGYEPFSRQRPEYNNFITKVLKSADVGIRGIETEKVEELGSISRRIPSKLVEKIEADLTEKDASGILILGDKRLIVKREEDGKIWIFDLRTKHLTVENKDVFFDLDEESDGTKRLVDLAPAFFSHDVQDRVVVIDEMDRSLHPKITEMLHDAHYGSENMDAQLIIATHEHYLLSQDFYRRDEIWFMEKDEHGRSCIYPLTDYKVRADKDIEKDYLLGRYGAAPYIRSIRDA